MQRPSREPAAIDFQEAGTLVFENLPSLVTFGPDDLVVKWPSLENVTVKGCPTIKESCLGHVDISQFKAVDIEVQGQQNEDTEIKIGRYFQLSDRLSTIEEHEINDLEELSKSLAINLRPSHFRKLKKFQAKNCDERLNEFLSILLKRSERLEHLVIEECKRLEHVFDLNKLVSESDERANVEYFPILKNITLCNLPRLNWIWTKDPVGIFGLGNLEHIKVMKCRSMKNLISASAAGKLQKVRELKLHSCEKVEEVIAMENEGVETQKRVIEFLQLSDLELVDLSNLIKFHRGNCAVLFPSLRSLKINKCPQMIAFITGFASAEEPSTTDERSFTELHELELDGCDKLIYIIPSNILSRFQNLEKLTVRNCDSLKEIFPFHGESHSGQSMLSRLSEMVLTHLRNLEQVINTKFASTRFFGNLQILRLKDCNSLKYLFLPFVVGSLMLREIEISDCMILEEIYVTKGEDMTDKILFSQLESIALGNLQRLSTFSLGAEFPSLKTLKVEDCPALKTFVSGFHRMRASSSNEYFLNSELLKLEELVLIKSETLLNVIPSNMLMSYKKLKKMNLEGCELLKEVFDLENIPDNNDKEMLPEVNELILNNLPSLTHVWNKEPQVPVFQCLESLQIIDCVRLERLFSLSTASCLKKLKILKLYGCKNMKEVLFAAENELTEVKPIKPMEGIECLILKDLPSLVSFCGHSCDFKWKQLRTVRVSKIPKMETFSQENPDTPLLRAVYVTYIEKCWQGNLNSTIAYLHKNPEM